MRFVQNRVQLIAQPIVQSHVAAEFEAVFAEKCVAGVAEVAVRISDELKRPAGKTLGKINQRVGNVCTAVSRVQAATEGYLAAECQVVQPVELCVADVAANFESVTGGGVREIIHKLIGVDRGAVGLVNGATQVGDCGASGNKPAGERELGNVA